MISLRVGKHLLVALMVCTIMSLAFIETALAYTDEKEDTSANGHAYAWVKGWYTEAPGDYYKTEHYGSVDQYAGINAYTRFRGRKNGVVKYNDVEPLDPSESYGDDYAKFVNFVETITDSDTGDNGKASVAIVPGLG